MASLKLPTKGIFQNYEKYKAELFYFLNKNALSLSSIFTPEVQYGSYQGYDEAEYTTYTIRFKQEVIIPKKFNYDTKDISKAMARFSFSNLSKNTGDSFKIFLQAIHELFPGLKQRYHNMTFNFPRQLNQAANSNINTIKQSAPLPPALPPAPLPSAPSQNNMLNEDSTQVPENTKKCMCPCSCDSPNAQQIGARRKTRSKKYKRRQTRRRHR
jgi:hypothetical protein